MSKNRPNPSGDKHFKWNEQASVLLKSVIDIASSTTRIPYRVANTLILNSEQLKQVSQDKLKIMQEAGAYLRELREVAGITRKELSEALDLDDQTIMEALEAGTTTLSFDLILRLAAVLARHDPVPFVLRFTRTFNPDLWQSLLDWGIGNMQLQIEREREFINILRSKDSARDLSDEQFADLLTFTQAAFDLGFNHLQQARRAQTESC